MYIYIPLFRCAQGETAQLTVFLEMHVLAFIKVKRRLRRIEEFSSISTYNF